MYWLLLPFAALTLFLGLRTPSPTWMALWLLLTVACLLGWVWLRYRLLFPRRAPGPQLTPLDPAELAQLRQQMQANREAEAAARHAAEEEAVHPIHPLAPATPAATEDAAASPLQAAKPPITGRAVFTLPEDPPRAIAPADRPL